MRPPASSFLAGASEMLLLAAGTAGATGRSGPAPTAADAGPSADTGAPDAAPALDAGIDAPPDLDAPPAWQLSTVDASANVGRAASIAVDAAGGVHVGCLDVTHAMLCRAYLCP